MYTKKQYIILLILFLISRIGYSQSELIIIEAKDKSLNDLLDEIPVSYNIKLAYDYYLISTFKVNINTREKSIEEALSEILFEFSLAYIKLENVYLIYPKTNERENKNKKTKQLYKKIYSVQGIVTDKETGEPLPFASVIINGTTTGVVSNQDGYFSFLGIKSDSIQLITSYLGYNPVNTIVLCRKNDQFIKIAMDKAVNNIDAAVIIGNEKSYIQSDCEASMITIHPVKISSISGLCSNDGLMTLQWMPGVKALSESSSIQVRQSLPDKNLVRFDGFSMYHSDHFFGYISAINSKSIKSIKLYKGSFRFARKWNSKLYSNIMLGTSYFSKSNDITTELPEYKIVDIKYNALKDFSIEQNNKLKISNHYQLEFGVNYNYINPVYNSYYCFSSKTENYNETDTFLIHNNTSIYAIYLQNTLDLNNKTSITAGIRSSYGTLLNKNFIEPRLRYNYKLLPWFIIKGATGIYYQFINYVSFFSILRKNCSGI